LSAEEGREEGKDGGEEGEEGRKDFIEAELAGPSVISDQRGDVR
jgi:hypothetical protein